MTLPKALQPYEYKRVRARRPEPSFERPLGEQEILTGFVNGKTASDLEERFANALEEVGLDYIFQYIVETAYTLPDEGKKVDFVVNDGGTEVAVEPGASFIHGTQSEKERSRQREAIINPILALRGIGPIIMLPLDRPSSAEDARELVAEVFVSV